MSGGYDPPYPIYTDPNFPAPAYNSSDQHQQQQHEQYYSQQGGGGTSYDPYGGQGSIVDHSGTQPGTADSYPPQTMHAHDPFNQPPQQWAQPVPHPHSQQDLGDPYLHPLGPPAPPAIHTSGSFDSTNQNPFDNQPHSHLPHHLQQTDDEPDSAPLLSHNRWSTTTGHYPGQADASLGLPGGFDPNLLQHQQQQQDQDQPIQSVQYGSIPQRQPRRYKTVKRVQLYNGNLVLDCQVPPKLLERVPRKDDREFTHMRYTAVTCDPDEFLNERYSLRQILYETPRRTELFIVLTMYNEDEVLFCRTMHGVMKNIQHLCERSRSKTWGADGWKKVVVCIVSDGRAKINSRTLSVLAAMGVYQDGVAKNNVAGKPVTGHLYEYTTQVSIDPDLKMKSAERGIVPVQMSVLSL